MAWNGNTTNEDGLEVLFGTERSASKNEGVTNQQLHRTLVHKFSYSDVADTDTAVPDAHAPSIPADSVIVRAMLYVTTAFVGPTGVLDIGLKQDDGTNTDDDGILTTGIATIDAAGDTVIGDGALVLQETGDLTAKRFTEAQWIMTTWDTAAFTAGEATLVVEYATFA